MQKPQIEVARAGNLLVPDLTGVHPFHIRKVKGARWHGNKWVVPATPLCAVQLANQFSIIDAHPKLLQLRAQGKRILQGIGTSADPYYPTMLRSQIDPWPHQVRAYDWLRRMYAADNGGALLAWGMACGKTRAALDVARGMGFNKILVGCPKAVVEDDVWAREADRYHPEHFTVIRLDQPSSKLKAIKLQNIRWSHTTNVIVVVNYESSWRNPLSQEIENFGFDFAICDEVHRIKGRSSKQGKFFRDMAIYVPYRLGLSGTPISNGALTDAFGPINFCDPGMWGNSIVRFEHIFAVKPPGQHFVVGWRNEDEFSEQFWKLARHESRDILDLPEEQDTIKYFDLPPGARRVYDDLETKFVAWLDSGEVIVPANAAVKVGKMQQVCGGAILDEDGDTKFLHNARGKLTAEILKDAGEVPVVIFCKYRADMVLACAACVAAERSFMELSGSSRQLVEWQQDLDPSSVLVVQIQSGAEGIDLTRAPIAIFFSVGHALSQYEQARARLSRTNQKSNAVSYIHLEARNTLDRLIYAGIQKKADLVASVVSYYDA